MKHIQLFEEFLNESVNEDMETQLQKIASLTGLHAQAIKQFGFLQGLNFTKILKFIEKGKLKDRMDFVTAVVGNPGNPIQKKMIKMFQESVNEAKQFDKDLDSMIKDIKRGMGWIDPEYVGDSWENSSDAIDFSIVKAEVFKKLLDAGVLYFSDDSGEEKGKAVKSSDLPSIMKIYESINVKYWADYNTDTSGQGQKEHEVKSKDFEDTFEDAVVYWNQEADGAENRIKGAQIQKIKKLAQEFFKKEGWISVNVIQAMIAQES